MVVYRVANNVNDRVYIGLTSCALAKRWREHLCAARTNNTKPLYRAMRKHGADNFYIEALFETDDEAALRAAEIELIETFGSHVASGGYNLTDYGFRHGNVGAARGESANSVLTEAAVRYIRAPALARVTNRDMTHTLHDMFGLSVSVDCVRDARRGDTWKHLDGEVPPIKAGRGARQTGPKSAAAKDAQTKHLAAHHSAAIKKAAEVRAGKRGSHARISEADVASIFYSPDSLSKTAGQFGVSKKMVLLIKQCKAHTYLTKGL